MTSRPFALLPLAAALALAGCATDDGVYPSLSIRDAERVSGVFDPVEAEPFVPAPQGAETLGRIGKLRADAQASHTRFLSAAEKARSPVAAARSAQPGADAWSVAQVALADLAGIRSESMISLAELDLLYVDAQTEGQELAEIESARADVDRLATEEDRLLDSLNSQVAN
ncbi:MAG TPA: hypothetical protein VL094_02550 [Sphingomonadaceae bacterium]|nr:hypothetical protein [Sphingomonadaceae bacterium]